MRSNLRTIVFSVAAFAIPVGGAFTLRDGLTWLPEALWAAALPAAVLAGLRWRLIGVAAAAATGAALIALVNGPAALAFRVTPLTLELWVLLTAWTAAALLLGVLGVWAGRRWRAGNLLQALTDPITGLPNRRRAELFLEHEFAIAELGRPLAILLLDVDGFTAYSATHGDALASDVLRSLGTILRQNTRSANLSAHWASDRFACLLIGAGEEGAFNYARMLQDAVRASSDVASAPSVSIGVASYDRDMSSPSDLLRSAEQALLLAKRDGGNRIRFHGRTFEETERATGDGGPVRRKSGSRKQVAADDRRTSVRDPLTGAPRTAFVFSADAGTRRRAVEQLERRGMRVTEGSRASETMRPLGREFDVVVVELTRDDPGVRDLTREVRRRHPATRIIGIPGFDGETIRASALAVHVDGHLLHAGGRWTFQPPLEELLRERDHMHGTALRALQLSDEVRAKEKEARAARQEGEDKLRSVVQSIREVLFRVDRSGAWISLSPAWNAITGHAVESSLGRPWLDFFHEDDRKALNAEFDSLSSIERPVVRREARIVTRSGGVRWVEVRAQLAHDRYGNIQSASGTLADITERRRAEDAVRRNEEYFRALIENAADVIMVMDDDGRVRYISPSVERVLGVGPDGESAVLRLDELCHPDDLPALRATLQSAGTPGSSATLEMRARHADGGWRHLAASIRNLTHIAAVRGFVVNAHDVTGRRDAERALRESEEALFRARKMDAIGVLAGGIANDFNNLLTAIQGHADIAIAALAPDHPIRVELGRIHDAASRAAALTRQLLAFGRRQVLRPRSIDLNVFISDLHKMLVRIIGDQIQVVTELAASPARIQADPMQIERVILNLAINAREAMPRGGVFSIRTRMEALSEEEARADDLEPGEYVVVSLSDTGHGIAPEIQQHVFDPFFSTKPQAIGVGLGLSTVYGIVRQSGGHVQVESRAGDDTESTGTTFTLWLPAARSVPDAEHPKAASDPDRNSETIALVEDEQTVRELAERILRGRGYNVIAAEDGLQAMDLLARYPNRIDMLVTDVVMPGMSGRDLADRIGTMRPGLQILFMSGYSPEAVAQHGVLARGTTFLEKPFSPDALLRRVRDMLDARLIEDPDTDALATPGERAEPAALGGVPIDDS